MLAPIDLGIGASAFVTGPLAVSTAPNAHGAMPNFAVRVDVEHSSAAEAGQVAARAGVRRLILTHIGAGYQADVMALADEARSHVDGAVEVAEELRPYCF